MSGDKAIFFCDLDPSQEREAEDWSSNNNGVMKSSPKPKPKRLSLVEPGANIELEVESSLPKSAVDPLTADLLACACHIYRADRMIVRPGTWYRRMELHIGVNNIDEYKPLEDEVSGIIGFLTRDQVRVRFYKLSGTRQQWELPELVPIRNGGVCVFSDNIDSMAGMALANKSTDILASFQYGPDKPRLHQVRLIKEIEAATSQLDYVGFKITPKKLAGNDITQRTRGFLQLSLAAAIAHRSGLRVIQVFGNGISSYHLWDRQICGPGFPVRDTHPFFLRDILALLDKLGIAPGLQIFNNFQFSTPAEILDVLKNHLPGNAQTLFNGTNNCLQQKMAKQIRHWNSNSIPHCGCCFPCKIRRLAALEVRFEMKKDYEAYSINPMSRVVASRRKKKLGRILQGRLKLFHVRGLTSFKQYLKDLLIPGRIMSVSGIGYMIGKLSWVDLDFTHSAKTDIEVRKRIIALHNRFAKKALKYFP